MKTGKVYLRKKEDMRIKRGHLWAFSNEIERTEDIEGNISPNARLYSAGGEFLGVGFYNKNSLIAFRILSDSPAEDIPALLKQKIITADNLRCKLFPDRNVYRMVFAESDFIPGLIIDRYGSAYVVQINSAGLEEYKTDIADILTQEFGAKKVLVKNDNHFRNLEGLTGGDEILAGDDAGIEVELGGVKYHVDFRVGQKTGLYLDQSENRIFTGRLCEGKQVLDCFCNTGGFGLHALANNAESVTFADSSAEMLKQVEKNILLNGFKSRFDMLEGDAFKTLKMLYEDKSKRYDVVIVDPPAFVKNRKKIAEALKGYLSINMSAMKLVHAGGIFVSASCSHHIGEADFLKMLSLSAEKTGRKLQLLHFAGPSPDHPRLLAMPETSYLKFGVFVVT